LAGSVLILQSYNVKPVFNQTMVGQSSASVGDWLSDDWLSDWLSKWMI